MRRIIINADDFGVNDEVTAEIKRMIELGAISSTTVMANGNSLDEVRRFASTHPEVSYGVHLCLSEFKSLKNSPILRKAGIVNENGDFIRMAIFNVKTYNNPEIKKAIKEELHAQIDVVSSMGFTISHADSHHHVHTIYPLRTIFAEVLHERGINKIRLGSEFRTLRSKAHIWNWIRRNQLNKFYRDNFSTTNYFYSYSEFVNDKYPINDEQTIELMCHPGHSGKKYVEEMKVVEKKDIMKTDLKLITYNEI